MRKSVFARVATKEAGRAIYGPAGLVDDAQRSRERTSTADGWSRSACTGWHRRTAPSTTGRCARCRPTGSHRVMSEYEQPYEAAQRVMTA